MDPEDPDSDPDHSQNFIISSFYLFRHILKISSKSVNKFLCYLVHKQTNRRTDKPRRKHNLLGGGNQTNVFFLNLVFHTFKLVTFTYRMHQTLYYKIFHTRS